MSVSAFAWDDMPLLVDDADILSDKEENSLSDLLESISEKHDMDIVIVTVDSLGYDSVDYFAESFYDNNGYAEDGIMLLVSMEYRDYAITKTGYGETVFTYDGETYFIDSFIDDLSDGNYYEAFETYANLSDDFIRQAKTDKPYESGNLPKDYKDLIIYFIVAVAIGFIIAFISTSVMKSKLKSVNPQYSANQYVKDGSMNVTQARDFFLYRHIDRRVRPKNNSSGTSVSSSGRTRSGKF